MTGAGRPLLRRFRVAALAIATAALGGCAGFSNDGGMAAVSQRVAADIGVTPQKVTTEADARAVRERVVQALTLPITADAAVQIAVINNRGLQARFAELGLAEADFVQAGLPANPSLGFLRMSGDGIVRVETRLTEELINLLTLPARRALGERQFRAAQYRAVDATLRVAADARRAYYRAVAAESVAAYLQQALDSAGAAAELTRRLTQTGAAIRLDQARVAANYVEVANQLRRARLDANLAREELARSLGLWGPDLNFALPSELPALPDGLHDAGNTEVEAVRRRVDLIAARSDLDTAARDLGLTQATRFVSLLELSGIRESERQDGATTRTGGFEIALEIPLFDLGEVATRRAGERYLEQVNLLAEKAIGVRSEARAAYAAYRATYDIARAHRDELVPLRRTVDEEMLYRYNGMLVDVLELLSSARESIEVNIATSQAIRDFFIAETDLQAAVIGGGTRTDAGAGL